MAQDALVALKLRNNFYRDGQRKLVIGLLLTLLVNVIMVFMLFYQLTHPPEPKYFSTSINGRIVPLVPIDQPNQSDASVLSWAATAAVAAFSYNFVNYRSEIQASSGYFTPDGWDQFVTALQQSNNLEAVKAKKLVVSAVATGAPVILQKGLLNGAYSWRIQLPIKVTYQSPNEFSQMDYMITMLVTRVSPLNYPRGIGIMQFVVAPAVGVT